MKHLQKILILILIFFFFDFFFFKKKIFQIYKYLNNSIFKKKQEKKDLNLWLLVLETNALTKTELYSFF